MSQVVKQSFESLIQQVKKNPNNAEGSFETTSVLGKQLGVQVSSRQFKFHFDEPEVLGGSDQAPNPVEYVLGALGACQAIVYRALSSLKGIDLESVTVKTRGDLDFKGFLGLDPQVRPGFKRVEFETIIVSDEQPEKLYGLSREVEALCPVLDIISNPLDVRGKVTIKTKKYSLEEA